jgi:hypothetical protein
LRARREGKLKALAPVARGVSPVISNWSDSGVEEDKAEPSESAVESAVAVTQSEATPVDGNGSDDDGHMYVSFS